MAWVTVVVTSMEMATINHNLGSNENGGTSNGHNDYDTSMMMPMPTHQREQQKFQFRHTNNITPLLLVANWLNARGTGETMS
jgi:hypothetical protein